MNTKAEYNFLLEQFDDVRILRYQVPNFEQLDLQQKTLIYYLSQATLSGRDITFDQHFAHNLLIRSVLENIYKSYLSLEKHKVEPQEFELFEQYLKKIWFSNGIHHHNSTDKIYPKFTRETWRILSKNYKGKKHSFPKSHASLFNFVEDLMFNPEIAPKRVSQDSSRDLVSQSAVNFYENVNQAEVEQFYSQFTQENSKEPISVGLNSKLIRHNNQITEEVYKLNGKYHNAIEQIVFWLKKAMNEAESHEQKHTIALLIEFYETGDLGVWDQYNIAWVNDTEAHIDFVNGFIETYGDPLGMKATWESIVNYKDIEATRRTEIISSNAQWFEDHSPVNSPYKKKNVTGVTAKAINVVQLGGDCFPTTPIGINLPNADWIRQSHGSKSVTIENIAYAYDQAGKTSGMLEEFVENEQEREWIKKFGAQASNLHTDLHECLGHGSGQMAEGISTEALKNYASPLEEARADLYALYFMMDDQMLELGLIEQQETAMAEYSSYIRNGLLTQLVRIKPGDQLEQAHMRNRQMVAAWCFEKGFANNVIEKYQKEGKLYVKINDFQQLRSLFGQLLREVQRIKSEGDYEAGRKLFETYGVKINLEEHLEILDRFNKLKIAPYSGFVNPILEPIFRDGHIVDVRLIDCENYAEQMIYYSDNYGFLI